MATRKQWLRLVNWIVVVVFVVAVVLGFWVVGSPRQARREASDRERVSDLALMNGGVLQFHRVKHRMPASFDELQNSGATQTSREEMADPVTHQAYEYRKIDSTHFEICAEFETDQSHKEIRGYVNDDELPFRRHRKGRQCFRLSVDKLAGAPDYDYMR